MNQARQRELADRIRRLEGMRKQARGLCEDMVNLTSILLAVDAELIIVRKALERESDSRRHPGIRGFDGR